MSTTSAIGGSNNNGMSQAVLDAANGPGKRLPGAMSAPGTVGAAGPAGAAGAAGAGGPDALSKKLPGEAGALASGKSGAELQNTFMKLLVTEMKNQDPTNPMDSSQMTSQLAQINTVSGIAGLNTTLSSLAAQMNASQQVNASNLIGKDVLAAGHDITVSKGAASAFGVQLGGPAGDVSVKITDSAGQTVRSLKLGAEQGGMTPLTWDGKNDAGVKVPDGAYQFKVSASNGEDPVTASGMAQSKVQSVIQQPNGTAGLKLGNGSTTSLSSVAQIL